MLDTKQFERNNNQSCVEYHYLCWMFLMRKYGSVTIFPKQLPIPVYSIFYINYTSYTSLSYMCIILWLFIFVYLSKGCELLWGPWLCSWIFVLACPPCSRLMAPVQELVPEWSSTWITINLLSHSVVCFIISFAPMKRDKKYQMLIHL